MLLPTIATSARVIGTHSDQCVASSQRENSGLTESEPLDRGTPRQQLSTIRPQVNADPRSESSSTTQDLQHVTLPPMPNFRIPPSPPGSPHPSSTATFSRFLELKSQSTHFNQRVAASTKLRDPSVTRNLLAYAGIDIEQGQYLNTLPQLVTSLLPQSFEYELERLSSSSEVRVPISVAEHSEPSQQDSVEAKFISGGVL